MLAPMKRLSALFTLVVIALTALYLWLPGGPIRPIPRDIVEIRARVAPRLTRALETRGLTFGAPVFLRIFKDFAYQRLGLSCRRTNGVCKMGGVGKTDRGYYIVKGGGLPPRVDVIGFNREVDWLVLRSRIRDISRGARPEIR